MNKENIKIMFEVFFTMLCTAIAIFMSAACMFEWYMTFDKMYLLIMYVTIAVCTVLKVLTDVFMETIYKMTTSID